MSYAGLCTAGDRFLDRTQTMVCDESIDMAGLDKAILNDVGVELLRCPCSSRGVTYESGCPRQSSNPSRFKRVAQSQSTCPTHKWRGFKTAERQSALERCGAHIMELVTGKRPKAEVVDLRGARG